MEAEKRPNLYFDGKTCPKCQSEVNFIEEENYYVCKNKNCHTIIFQLEDSKTYTIMEKTQQKSPES